jgi:hypothetical protein
VTTTCRLRLCGLPGLWLFCMSGDSESMWLLLWTIGVHRLWLLFASMDCMDIMDYLDNA